jgi:hypothetical protein
MEESVRRKKLRRLSILAVLSAGLLLGGCGTLVLPANHVATGLKQNVQSATGVTIKSAKCPRDLTAKVGATEQCTVTTAAGNRYLFGVQIYRVKGSEGFYHIRLVKRIS